MLLTRVMPCLLLRDTALVKTVKFKKASYVGDPINTVRIFNEKEVDELIVLDITATVEQRQPRFELLAEVASECFMPLTYGGGVDSIATLSKLFNIGIEKVALNSHAVHNPDFVTAAADKFGSQAIVVSLDVSKKLLGGYEVLTHSCRKKTGLDSVAAATLMEKAGAGEILLTSVDREGTMTGYDTKLISTVSQAIDIPLVANGGAASVDDFARAVNDGGASAVAAGSMVVYQGKNRAVLVNFPSPDELAARLDRPNLIAPDPHFCF